MTTPQNPTFLVLTTDGSLDSLATTTVPGRDSLADIRAAISPRTLTCKPLSWAPFDLTVWVDEDGPFNSLQPNRAAWLVLSAAIGQQWPEPVTGNIVFTTLDQHGNPGSPTAQQARLLANHVAGLQMLATLRPEVLTTTAG